jgi:hypothetical protein
MVGPRGLAVKGVRAPFPSANGSQQKRNTSNIKKSICYKNNVANWFPAANFLDRKKIWTRVKKTPFFPCKPLGAEVIQFRHYG